MSTHFSPALPSADAWDEERDIFFNIINRFIGYHSREAQRATCNDTASEYPFVAMDTRQVYEQVRFVHHFLDRSGPRSRPPSFLDIGCGIGNVLIIAEQFGFEVFGIEKDDYPFRMAAKLFDDPGRILQGDINTYEGYRRFDVLYYFRPHAAGEFQRRFEKRIEEQMRPGAILIANHRQGDTIEEDRRFARLHPDLPVWQKTAA